MTPRSTFAEFRLPPGRHGIPPEEVAANQRWRLLGAVAEELAENGRIATTSTAVSRRAGVSPATFYKHFDNISACLLASFEVSAESLLEAIDAGCREPQLPWSRRLRDALDSGLRFLAAEPAIAAMLGAAAHVAEPEIAVARRGLIERLALLLAEGRGPGGAGEEADDPEQVELVLVGGALMVISDRVADGECERMPELAPELAELLETSLAAAAA